ncbi:MAG: helix-turn-helix domain-containing protein [Salinivirgaceae bacterium]|nr:helix-turn-helix domain-containing protein [Salinivirgaceae bacterium]
MNFTDNKQLQLALEFVEYTGRNIFLTGKAGTGKTTFLHYIKKHSTKRSVVVAPTGVAAINAGGVTIHSFFQIAPGILLPDVQINRDDDSAGFRRINKEKVNIMRSLDLLIIDEISMVRADLLDAIDGVLKQYRNNSKPFGGVQLLLIGDLQQLAPVVKDNERALLQEHYSSFFFFGSRALQQTNYISVELQHIYRQTDQTFVDLLNKVRDNQLDMSALEKLNSRYKPNVSSSENVGYITLTTHNYQAQQINEVQLSKVPGKPQKFLAGLSGDFPEGAYPTDSSLGLKVGAQVMFVKNDPSHEKQFYNGKIGIITHMDDDAIYVQCEGDDAALTVTPLTWENRRYTLDATTKEITENVIGTFTQIPLKLAWAITIHKSQGLTFERAIIDAQAAFAHGQVYVALSRCKTMEGMILSSRIETSSIRNDNSVLGFTKNISENQPDEQLLKRAQYEFQLGLLHDLFDFSNLRKQIYTLNKIANENLNILDASFGPILKSVIEVVNRDFFEVGKKFTGEINKHAATLGQIENNLMLQERIKKASIYYLPKIKVEIIDNLAKIDYDTDNKQVKKSLTDIVAKIEMELHIKAQCLAVCEIGFSTSVFLETKAKASIEDSAKRPKSVSKLSADKAPLEASNNPMLVELLKQWRNMAAEELNVPIYMILPRKSMIEISNRLPADSNALRSIHGLGKIKVDKFGADIVSIVMEYCANNNLKPNYGTNERIEFKPKEKKRPTREISFEMFQDGKTVEEIAAERKLVETTIHGHLVPYVQSGDISIDQFVTPDKVALITNYVSESKDKSLSTAKEALGNRVSFSDLKFVYAHLEYTNSEL